MWRDRLVSLSLGGKSTIVEGLLLDVKTQVGFFPSVHLSLSISMGGKFTTVEGLLQDVKRQVGFSLSVYLSLWERSLPRWRACCRMWRHRLVSLSLSVCLSGREVYHGEGLAAGCEETGWFLFVLFLKPPFKCEFISIGWYLIFDTISADLSLIQVCSWGGGVSIWWSLYVDK